MKPNIQTKRCVTPTSLWNFLKQSGDGDYVIRMYNDEFVVIKR